MENLNITLIQSNLHWENIDKNLQQFSEKMATVKEPTDLIVLPEMFSTGFSMNSKNLSEGMNGKTLLWMRKHCKEKGCAITGSVIISENGNYFNRLIWMWADGSYEIYNKRHLFQMANEDNYYTPGKYRKVVELKGWKICPLICYDLRFPVWSRNTWKKTSKFIKDGGREIIAEYDVLIYVANWPERRAHPWKSLLVARAIENQSYVIGVNRVGSDGNGV